MLSRKGWRVCVLERNGVLGGAIRTSGDLTEPGFTHELMASWHPLFAGSAA
jgi:phytoene dehydrogenase-like protein